MTMHGDHSLGARERALRTAEVAGVFAFEADLIVAKLVGVPEGHVLVAVVDAQQRFLGTHHVDREDLVRRVPELEHPDSWAMVFSPGITATDVRRRAEQMGSIARQRVAAIDRILARRSAE
jgi:hypothetical protein